MGADTGSPYLYDGPTHRPISFPYSHYHSQSQSTFATDPDVDPTKSTFNPRAVTQASYARLSQASLPPKPKQEGPLIDFNKHPDSYVVFGDGVRPDYKSLPPGTKKAVVATRWTQFGLRLVQEIVAVGLLAGTICMKGTTGAETYLLRIPQAWDSLITLYAIFHLVRAAKGRTPGSSASYHTFALIMDTALIPLYIYIVLLLNNRRSLPPPQYGAAGNMLDGQWRLTSFFATQRATDILLLVCFVAACAAAGLHLLSCGLDLYLVIIFRKISSLPPDMNPLEDNLTGRTRSARRKHKYKNSELTVLDEKDTKHMSASTLSVNTATPTSPTRGVPFALSRANASDSTLAFSPHNPDSARLSRAEQDAYHSAASSPRTSRYEVRPDGRLDVRSRGHGSRSPQRRPASWVENSVHVSTGDLSQLRAEHNRDKELPAVPLAAEEIGRALSPDLPHAAVQMSPSTLRKEQGAKLLNDNWYVLDAEDSGSDNEAPARAPVSRFAAASSSPRYTPVQHDTDRQESMVPPPRSPLRAQVHETLYGYAPETIPQPLGMHPPTPPEFSHLNHSHNHHQRQADTDVVEGPGVERHPTVTSNATVSSSVYSDTAAPSLTSSPGPVAGATAGVSTPKGRYYGNLAAATMGVRGASPTPAQQQQGSPTRVGGGGGPGRGYGGLGGYGLPPSPQASRTPSPEKNGGGGGGRVISRSGADIADESVLYLPSSSGEQGGRGGYGMRSRREVSGKVAEEGRVGGGGGGGRWR
ncbi:hypothetical protein LTR53_001373 [Teratosphaeriaceae sp. CCFEE 6253]|nr:hypothetical protein LTR53_001373 [Teratosphaeriaceae sp. CCFEE 6253]